MTADAARLHGAIAATVTPLRDDGASLDADAIDGLCAFLVAGGVDGVLTCGTTGEGVLLSVDERRAVTERFLGARPAVTSSRTVSGASIPAWATIRRNSDEAKRQQSCGSCLRKVANDQTAVVQPWER